MRKRNSIKYLVVFLLFLMAICLLAYPYIANYVFEHRADSVIDAVEKSTDAIPDEEKGAAIQEAREYNAYIANGTVELTDPFTADQSYDGVDEYESLLRSSDDGVMGYVEIPVIDVSLPIYHGTSEEVLQKGVGHLQGTSLPVGGESTHTVLTGHTGLSHAKLFTDLTEVKEGDIFFLYVMGGKLAYQVDQIEVVLPSELDNLYVEQGKDLCTLVTCTPYGVNSHRLLVRGVRTDYQEAVDNPDTYQSEDVESKWMAEYKRALLISIGCFAGGLVIATIILCIRVRGKS